MGKVNIDIMTYKPYWYECDKCGFISDKYEKRSQLTKVIARHLHEPLIVRPSAPAPMRPSQVTAHLKGVTA